MFKSLEKLMSRGLYYFDHDMDAFIPYDINNAANEIQAEIDKLCLFKPLFDDDEPVQFGDRFTDGIADLGYSVDGMLFWKDGRCELFSGDKREAFYPGDRVGRPLKPDMQEEINADAKLDNMSYCAKYSITYAGEEAASIAVRKHLLYRQRKLDGVEE